MADRVIPVDKYDSVWEGFELVEHEETGEGVHEKYLALAEALELAIIGIEPDSLFLAVYDCLWKIRSVTFILDGETRGPAPALSRALRWLLVYHKASCLLRLQFQLSHAHPSNRLSLG